MSSASSARAFATSSSRKIVPPESPQYIDVPSSYQADLPLPRRAKGILPTPRELFPARRPDKPGPKYLKNVTPDSTVKVSESQLSEIEKYRARMGTLRKNHLRQGLTELHQRKQEIIYKMHRQSAAKSSERSRLISQAEREDARLTNSSIPSAMQPAKSHVLEDVDAKQIYDTKKGNLEYHTARKEEERRDALHTLYMNARNFITTEEQLLKEIDFQFQAPEAHQLFQNGSSDGTSMWNKGVPDTVATMVKRGRGSDEKTKLGGDKADRVLRDQERMKKIAEKLSGGRI